jgi:hypothetical protein
MNLINTPEDLQAAEKTPELIAFLTNLYNDCITFDDAEYPQDYDRTLTPEDEGYIEPIVRKVWNSGAAAAWGFNSREELKELLGL